MSACVCPMRNWVFVLKCHKCEKVLGIGTTNMTVNKYFLSYCDACFECILSNTSRSVGIMKEMI